MGVAWSANLQTIVRTSGSGNFADSAWFSAESQSAKNLREGLELTSLKMYDLWGSHRGVPLAKGTETQTLLLFTALVAVPQRCPPREGD